MPHRKTTPVASRHPGCRKGFSHQQHERSLQDRPWRRDLVPRPSAWADRTSPSGSKFLPISLRGSDGLWPRVERRAGAAGRRETRGNEIRLFLRPPRQGRPRPRVWRSVGGNSPRVGWCGSSILRPCRGGSLRIPPLPRVPAAGGDLHPWRHPLAPIGAGRSPIPFAQVVTDPLATPRAGGSVTTMAPAAPASGP